MSVSPAVMLTAIGLILGLIAGFVMHRADFCIAGMFRDLFLFRSFAKLRVMVLYVVVAMALFEAARLLGLLPLYPFPMLGPATFAGILGGVIFGVGMVLAGGCVVGTLYRLGAGSRVSFIAFAGLILGSTLYAEFHPFWKSLLTATTMFSGSITIPLYLNLSPTPLVLISIIPLGWLVALWWRRGQLSSRLYAKGALHLWQAALLLAVVSLASYLLIGMPLGITTAYSKIGAMGEQILFPEHFANVSYFATQSISCRNPLTGMMFKGGPGPAMDSIALIQFPLIAGIILGGAVSALSLGEFTVRHPAPWRQYISAAVGGVLMGLASRMAPACNVWHLMGGLPVLAFASIFFLAGILPGAWLGACMLTRWVVR